MYSLTPLARACSILLFLLPSRFSPFSSTPLLLFLLPRLLCFFNLRHHALQVCLAFAFSNPNLPSFLIVSMYVCPVCVCFLKKAERHVQKTLWNKITFKIIFNKSLTLWYDSSDSDCDFSRKIKKQFVRCVVVLLIDDKIINMWTN